MRIYRLMTTALSGAILAGVSTAAFAGCGSAFAGQNVSGQDCNPSVIAHTAPMDRLAPVHTYTQNPYGYLKTFAYKNTPNVNIMRLHSRPQSIGLADRPIQFTGGCTPTSTVYCRAPRSNAVPAPAYRPMPSPQPMAMAPTNSVNNFAGHYVGPVRGNVIGHSVAQQSYQQPSTGAYWEKASGPAIVDGLPATQILCRRQAPAPAPVSIRVVRPVIGVPVPVPTPYPVPVYQQAPQCNGYQGPVLAGGNHHYGSRWTR